MDNTEMQVSGRILHFTAKGNGEIVVPGYIVSMQYHPSQMNISQATQTNNVNSINGTVTFVPNKNSYSSDIQLTAYMSAIVQDDITIDSSYYAKASLTSALFPAISFLPGTREILTTWVATASTVSLAKGRFDLVSGYISYSKVPIGTTGLAKDQYVKIEALSDMMKNGVPIEVSLDLIEAAMQDLFVIKSISIDVEKLRYEDGKTMLLKLNMSLSKYGTKSVGII